MFASLLSFVDPSVSFNLNLDVIRSDKVKSKSKRIQQKQKIKFENKSNIIYFKPNKD